MSKHASISPAEAADRLAIRELVESYAQCADPDKKYSRNLGKEHGIELFRVS
jgi:hypothetical protein